MKKGEVGKIGVYCFSAIILVAILLVIFFQNGFLTGSSFEEDSISLGENLNSEEPLGFPIEHSGTFIIVGLGVVCGLLVYFFKNSSNGLCADWIKF